MKPMTKWSARQKMYIGTLVCWYISIYIGIIGILVHWYIDILVYWYIGTLVYWYIGVLVYWYIGTNQLRASSGSDNLVYWYCTNYQCTECSTNLKIGKLGKLVMCPSFGPFFRKY